MSTSRNLVMLALQQRSSGSGTSMGSSVHRQQRRNYGFPSRPIYQQRLKLAYGGNGSDSDLFAPPPTPRSQYMSDYNTHGETTEGDEDVDDAIAQVAATLEENMEKQQQQQQQQQQHDDETVVDENASLLEDAADDDDELELFPSDDAHYHVAVEDHGQQAVGVQLRSRVLDDSESDKFSLTSDDDDAETVLLAPCRPAPPQDSAARDEEAGGCIYNPPPSPVTD